MTPEDVLLEAMTAAVQYGNATEIRRAYCDKLKHAMERAEMHGVRWNAIVSHRDDGRDDEA